MADKIDYEMTWEEAMARIRVMHHELGHIERIAENASNGCIDPRVALTLIANVAHTQRDYNKPSSSD